MRAVARINPSASPAGRSRCTAARSRSSLVAADAAMARTGVMGTRAEASVIAVSSRSICCSPKASRRHRWATSARTIAGVKQSSAASMCALVAIPRGVPRISSIHAKESIVSLKPIPLSELRNDALTAPEHPTEGSRPPFPHEFADRLVSTPRVEHLSQPLQFGESLPRDSNRRLRWGHTFICMRACIITISPTVGGGLRAEARTEPVCQGRIPIEGLESNGRIPSPESLG